MKIACVAPSVASASAGSRARAVASGEIAEALQFVSLAMQEHGATNYLLNLRGIYREKLGNRDGAQESYEQAADWSVARFNLALLHYQAGRHEAALHAVDRAIALDPTRACHSLRGDILDKLGKADQARLEWQDAISGQPEWQALDDCELGWMEHAARVLQQTAMRERISAQRKRQSSERARTGEIGELPVRVSDQSDAPTP